MPFYFSAVFSICCRNIVCLFCFQISSRHHRKRNFKYHQTANPFQKAKHLWKQGTLCNSTKQFETKVKETTVNWRIYTLVQTGVLSRIGRGKFTLGETKNFVPQISSHKTNYIPNCGGISLSANLHLEHIFLSMN